MPSSTFSYTSADGTRILNETNRGEVLADLSSWLDRVVPRMGGLK
jgi:hypothetical protein